MWCVQSACYFYNFVQCWVESILRWVAHFTGYRVKCGVCSLQCWVWSVDVQCWVCSIACQVLSVQCWMWSVECAVLNVKCWVWSIEWKVLSVKCWCAVLSVQCWVCSVQCWIGSVQCWVRFSSLLNCDRFFPLVAVKPHGKAVQDSILHCEICSVQCMEKMCISMTTFKVPVLILRLNLILWNLSWLWLVRIILQNLLEFYIPFINSNYFSSCLI